MRLQIGEYAIQSWLGKAEGQFDIDLAESGIQPCSLSDLKRSGEISLDYGSNRGCRELRQAVAGLYGVGPESVLITHGSQEALFLLYAAYLRPGDHVIAFTPGWQQAWEVPAFFGADVSRVSLSDELGYRIDWRAVENAVRKETRLVVLNSPHNPTGTRCSGSDFVHLKELAARGIGIVNDEDYVFDFAQSVVRHVPRAVSASSLSKLCGFPGLRIGWSVGPEDVIEAMVNLKRYVTVCNSPLCEQLALEVLARRGEFLDRYSSMRDSGLARLRAWAATHGLAIVEPEGVPFAYVPLDIPIDSQTFALGLLKRQRVLVMPAEVFGDSGALRISFGRPDEILLTGLDRIAEALARYQ
jgi:aspartate/methionine/tyrosine aminotransferase